MKKVLLAILFGSAGLVSAFALQGALGQVPWYVSRISGLTAFVLLSASVVCGLLLSGRAPGRPMPKIMQFELHSFLAVLSISFIAVHGFALLFDGFFHFTPLSVIVPFTSPYRPLWTGLGVIAAWFTALIAASTYARKHVGYRAWRRLHYCTFACYALSLLHGMTSGTDTGSLPVIAIYVLSVASVALALAFRIERKRTVQSAPVLSRRRNPAPLARPQSLEQRPSRTTR